MSIHRWVDEDIVYIYNGMLLSYKKEQIWVSCSEVDEPRACYTKWNKSERVNKYIKAYMWNLDQPICRAGIGKQTLRTYVQTWWGEAGWEELGDWDWYWDTHTHIHTHTHTHTHCAHSLIQVQLFVTPWTVALQAPLSMGILQTRILKWIVRPSSRGSSQPRNWTQVSCIAGRFFTIWATREAHGYTLPRVK